MNYLLFSKITLWISQIMTAYGFIILAGWVMAKMGINPLNPIVQFCLMMSEGLTSRLRKFQSSSSESDYSVLMALVLIYAFNAVVLWPLYFWFLDAAKAM